MVLTPLNALREMLYGSTDNVAAGKPFATRHETVVLARVVLGATNTGIDTEVVQLILVAGLLPLAGTLTYWYRDDVVCADADMLAVNSSADAVDIHKARKIFFFCMDSIDYSPFLLRLI
jgi:hypothetical protein